MRKTDVLIVGGGLAGRNAAAELRERFPRLAVLMVDAGGCASTEIMNRRMPDSGCASCRYAGVCRGLCAGVMLSELSGSWRNFCLRRHVDVYGVEL